MRKFSADLIFYLHVVIVAFWYILFFIPNSIWLDKTEFHFQMSLLIVGHQLVWGALILPWTKNYRLVCVLTTLMQILRGQSVSDKKNYEHSFSKEFLRKININLSHRRIAIITFTTFTVVTIQRFLL